MAFDNDDNPTGYVITQHDLEQIKMIANTLGGGSAAERDACKALWSIIPRIEADPVYDLEKE